MSVYNRQQGKHME